MNKLLYIFSFIFISFSGISQQFSEEHVVFISESNNSPGFAHAADISGDNIPEILSSTENTFWYTSNEVGVFFYGDSIPGWSGLANSGDFDNDGDIDLVLWKGLAGNEPLFIYYNDGEGGFESIAIDSPFGTYRSLTVDDLNLDGLLDILVAVPSQSAIFWMENEGEGVFADAEQIAQGLEQVGTFSPVDIDGDGDKDIVTSETFGDMYWFENDGVENFSQMEFVAENSVFSGAWSICSEDFDGDGDIDVAVNTYSNELVWFSNIGDGSFSEVVYICDVEYCSTGVIRCGDIDNDGDIDLINSRGVWFENDGNGDFASNSYYSETYFIQTTMELVDLDKDGDLDVLSAIQSPIDEVIWFENLLGEGCMDNTACNYDESAFIDDGSCCFGVCGCMDESAINYKAAANCDDGSCLYEVDNVSVANYHANPLRLFPNPMNDISVLYLPENKKYNVKLYSFLGELVLDFGVVNSDRIIINRKKIPNGVFIVEVVDVFSKEINRIRLIVE